jgi:mRNA interferase MazF
VLTPLPQADGRTKNRPCVALCQMPRFGDWLVCGVSTQLHHAVPGFDDTIASTDPDFAATGLTAPSLIRPGFLAVIPASHPLGSIGSLAPERHSRHLRRLAAHLDRARQEPPEPPSTPRP